MNGDVDVAREAAIGWGGDAYVSWRDGDRSCIRVTFVGDDDGETSEIADALSQWAEDQPDASVGGGDGEAVLTSCR